ncbi:MAG: CoA pyrophosphatase [Candidatus Sericytochromatia bacterium]
MRIDDQALRQRLIPETEIPNPVPGGLTLAAVLVTLHEHEGEDWLLFTRRTEHLRKHKGQISFPGGKYDLAEDQQLHDTALRESWEEIGLLPNHVTLLGSLEPFDTISSYLLYPFVGRFPWPYDLRVNEDEISELIRVPVRHLLDPACYRSRQRDYLGHSITIHYYDYEAHTIWGITGFILFELLKLLA